ncbi:unnamed protein product [Effrenium voratum]|nr:unnamed protein product [Effrenium voratum]
MAFAIPSIVHQTAPADRTRWDPRWEKCQLSWRRACPAPEFRYMLWDDDGLRQLVEEAFPQFLTIYDSYKEHIQRVDFARAAMLYIHGGLYVDMDVEALACPFGHFPAGKVSVVASPYVQNEKHQNSMMASPPGHPFWVAMAEEAVRRRSLPMYRTTWQLTGPQLLDSVIEANPQVNILPAAMFNPSMQSPEFFASGIVARHFCTSVWTHQMDKLGMSLYQAARAGDLESVQSAVAAGADLGSRDYAGLTPLHHASIRGDAAMVELLASLHADVSAKDKNATTPLHYAAQLSKLEVGEDEQASETQPRSSGRATSYASWCGHGYQAA